MLRRTSSDCSSTSKPATLALPSVGGRKQVRTRMVVVFPAPFLPRNPTISPLPTSKEMFLTATWRAYRLVRPSTLIISLYTFDGCQPESVTEWPLGPVHVSGEQYDTRSGVAC